MKESVYVLLILLAHYASASQGQEIAGITNSSLELEINPYRLPVLSSKKGYLENTKIAVGTIVKSYHFNKKDHHYYNESHNGMYININQWSAGTYTNTAYEKSIFLTYNPNLYTNKALTVNLIAGLANGYDGLEYAQGDYLPVLGASVQWGFLKTLLSHDVAAVGIEVPLN